MLMKNAKLRVLEKFSNLEILAEVGSTQLELKKFAISPKEL